MNLLPPSLPHTLVPTGAVWQEHPCPSPHPPKQGRFSMRRHTAVPMDVPMDVFMDAFMDVFMAVLMAELMDASMDALILPLLLQLVGAVG